MAPRVALIPFALMCLLPAACSEEHGGGVPPAAPSGLGAEPLTGGAHLTWTDNATDETQYMVLRMEDGVDTEYEVITTLPFDAESFHDTPLTSGSTYMFKVMAMNDEGESESNEVTFDAP